MKRVSPTAVSDSCTRRVRSDSRELLVAQRQQHVVADRRPRHQRAAVLLEDERHLLRWAADSLPVSSTSPRVGRSRPAMHLSSVVLPQPDGPTTQTNSPVLDRERDASIASRLLRARFRTSCQGSLDLQHRRTCVIGTRGAPAAMPGERTPFDEQEGDVEEVAEQADQQDRRPHRRHLERVLRDQQYVADAARAREVLG